MEAQQQWVLPGMGAGTGFSKDFNSDLEKGLNRETLKSIDDTNLSQPVKCHAGDGGWGDLVISHAGRSRRIPTEPGGQIGFSVGGHQEWYWEENRGRQFAAK